MLMGHSVEGRFPMALVGVLSTQLLHQKLVRSGPELAATPLYATPSAALSSFQSGTRTAR
jgi:hypothetical protein